MRLGTATWTVSLIALGVLGLTGCGGGGYDDAAATPVASNTGPAASSPATASSGTSSAPGAAVAPGAGPTRPTGAGGPSPGGAVSSGASFGAAMSAGGATSSGATTGAAMSPGGPIGPGGPQGGNYPMSGGKGMGMAGPPGGGPQTGAPGGATPMSPGGPQGGNYPMSGGKGMGMAGPPGGGPGAGAPGGATPMMGPGGGNYPASGGKGLGMSAPPGGSPMTVPSGGPPAGAPVAPMMSMPGGGGTPMTAPGAAVAGVAPMMSMPGGAPGFPGGGPGSPGQQAPAKPPADDYAARSEWSFATGNDRDGLSYYYANLLSDDTAADSNYSNMKWIPSLKHPALAVHFAIGVDSSFEEDPQPIGVTQNLPTGNNRRVTGPGPPGAGGPPVMSGPGGFPRGGGPGGPGGAANGVPDPVLQKYGGELAKLLVDGLEARFQRADFGEVLKDASSANKRAPTTGAGMRSGPGMMPGIAMPGMPGMAGGIGGQPPSGGAPDDSPSQVIPGLTMLGRNGKRELLAKAKAEGADVLIIISVAAKSRAGLVDNDTSIEMFDVLTAEPIKGARTRRLNNVKVQKDREKNADDDTVEATFERLFAAVDEQLVLQPMPAGIQPEHVAGRAKGLAVQPPTNLLGALTELHFYYKKGLINDEQIRWCYIKMLGDSRGESLLNGDAVKRKEVLASELPKD